MALNDTGRVFVWGKNTHNQVGIVGGLAQMNGLNMRLDPSTPRILTSMKIVDIVCGQRQSLALTAWGHVYAWGHDQYYEPLLVQGDDGTFARIKVVKIAAGNKFNACLDENGHIFTWGPRSIGHPKKRRKQHPTRIEGFGILFNKNSSLDVSKGPALEIIGGGRHLAVFAPRMPQAQQTQETQQPQQTQQTQQETQGTQGTQ